ADDDPDTERRQGLDLHWAHGHAPRHARPGFDGSRELEARSPCWRSLYLPRASGRSRQDSLARWHRLVSVRHALGPRKVHLALGVIGRGVDLSGPDGLYAGRDGLGTPATDTETAECRVTRI